MRLSDVLSGSFALAAVLTASSAAGEDPRYPWIQDGDHGSLSERIQPPPGYDRLAAGETSFASWLRGLPLRAPGAVVRLHDGREKADQAGVFAVLDIDVGSRDLQQCADAVIRLRAEYLLQAGCGDRISFDFTSGHPARWTDWRTGLRPRISGREVSWVRESDPDGSYESFRSYLDTVFTYAGSFSLARELGPVEDPAAVRPGDVFIQGGFPGHAVLVADVARNARGERMFLLVQSYMPAQDIHVLRNPEDRRSPWHRALREGTLRTSDWTFEFTDLRRFSGVDCPGDGDDPEASPPRPDPPSRRP